MIVARQGSIPTRDSYTHVQNILSSGSVELRITTASPVPLSSGTWYVRVLNNADEAIGYSLTASGDIADPVGQTRVNAVLANGRVHLLWNSADGASYQVQASSDLENWSSVSTITASGSTATYSEPATASRRFYRVVPQ